MIKDQLESILSQTNFQFDQSPDLSFDFDLDNKGVRNQFHILLQNDELHMKEGLSEKSLGLLMANEDTLDVLLQMGGDLIQTLLDLSFGKLPNSSEIPDIDTKVSIQTELDDRPVNFNIYLQEQKLYVIEDPKQNGDVRIRIKSSYLPKLFSGDINIGLALLTGKIKIKNKSELLKLLAKFGLSF